MDQDAYFSVENVDLKRKDYLKIFFEADDSEYEREGRRYFLPNIYNNNEYNIEINSIVYGMPDNNLGMNAKKPFLSIKSRKYPAPYLLDGDDVILQKQFFDYLMNLVSAGKYQVYVDTERKKISGYANGDAPDHVESGYYFRIRKGKQRQKFMIRILFRDIRESCLFRFALRIILDVNMNTNKNIKIGIRYMMTG